MSDEFGTVNVRRGERSREIEILRQHYRRHQEALERMIEDAPTERLASEYERLLAEINTALEKLDELEGRGRHERAVPPPAVPPAAPPPPSAPPRDATRHTAPGRRMPEGERPHGDPLRGPAEPGMRPLVGAPATDEMDDDTVVDYSDGEEGHRSRAVLIAVIAVVALAVIAFLIWRASSNRPVVEETPVAAVETQPVTPVEVLTVTPAVQNYGVIRKGTRAARQFEVTNTTDEPVSIQLARSTCRCLYYEYAEVIPPNGRESVTVTIDGARAPAGELRESVPVTIKGETAPATTLEIEARIQ